MINRVLMATLAVALVVAVGFGTGYTTSKAAFSDDVAYLPKGSGVGRFNASSNEVDARTAVDLATGDQVLEVVQVRPDSVWVVNHDTNTVTPLPTDTLQPGKGIKKAADHKLKLLAGGGQAYLLDKSTGKLDKLDGTHGKPGTLQIPPVADAVADTGGTVWAYTRPTGELLEISKGALKGRHTVADPGALGTLTTVANLPVVYLDDTGQAAMYDSGGLRRKLELSARQGLVSQPGTTSSVVTVVSRAEGTLTVGDFQSRRMTNVTLKGRANHQFDRPLVHHGRVYVPDYTKLQLVIVELATGRIRSETVPSKSGEFQLTARDDRVWVNDQKHPITLSFDANGKRIEIDAGTTKGAEDDALPSPKPSPTPTPPVVRASDPPEQRTPPKIVSPTAAPKPRHETVPNLVGMAKAQACERLEPNLRCVAVARQDETAQEATGTVLSTTPSGGTRVPRGSAVTVYYRGPLAVPKIMGLPADQACQKLDEAQLQCVRRPSGTAKTAAGVGVVQAQDPQPDSPAETGTKVTITFPGEIEVGTYTNLPITDACAAVQQAGLVCKPQESGPGKPSDVVQSQQPTPGSGLAQNGTVTVTYLGKPAVPSVKGMTPDAACAALRTAFLDCAPKASGAATLETNKILAQAPEAGTRQPSGTAVTIEYQPTDPAALNRFKAPAPRRGNFLSPGGGAPAADWHPFPAIGRVYRVEDAGKVNGLHIVNRSRCESKCGEAGGYYFSANPTPQPDWAFEGPAFACFVQPIPGTVPLQALFNKQAVAWAWAPADSGEYNTFVQGGFEPRFTVCHVWPR
ncbi:PASTA domain-containing protein [Nonomuraea endophytica]|uniref:Beta-lactam-binding protein with PASTA domain n=1 Tax=Nonomuraea endophytica TaxID=714136 RepID=A0A7W7ZZJ7_9ACTN|nr:Stk1 family PASTA domain-containing Ser/Thr kinase [Nonomuraea endophytica]MBB5076753.1 beta-lactam-binding protein with PASTA domain [Nonomuraea endophytica]